MGLSGSAGKIKVDRPDPGFTLSQPTILLPKIGLCSEVSDFPALPENTTLHRELKHK